jgi:hypothetical protein
MSHVLVIAMALAAAVFIAVSATMNAMFLSTFGRTGVEAGLLTALSIAADVAKAALPVVILRALLLRAWLVTTLASMMLAVVIALSLASGMGFAALTRNASTSAQQSKADTLAAAQRDGRDLDARIDALPVTLPVGVIETELAATQTNWRWSDTKSCVTVNTTAAHKFCAGVFKLRSDLASAQERDRLTAERRGTRTRIETLQTAGASTDADPQSTALAAIFRVEAATPRLVLTTALAVVLELGSVILVVLLAGPALLGWRKADPVTLPQAPVATPKTVTNPVQLSPSSGKAHWQRQRDRSIVIANRSEGHAR